MLNVPSMSKLNWSKMPVLIVFNTIGIKKSFYSKKLTLMLRSKISDCELGDDDGRVAHNGGGSHIPSAVLKMKATFLGY